MKHKIKELRDLSVLMDSRFEGPFGIRFGLDALLGLIPVVGDLVTSFSSVYIIYQAALLGCTPATLMRMILNVLVENLVDFIPFLGNLFDFYWKANNLNITLLERHLENPKRLSLESRILVIVLFILFIMLLGGFIYLSYLTLMGLIHWLQNYFV